METDRRKSKRFQIVELDVENLEHDEVIGKVVNLSEGGLLMISDNEFAQSETYNFRIPFKHTINGEVHFDFSARVVWCYPNTRQPSKFSVGLEFSENAELQTIFIQQMVKNYGSD